MTKYIWFLAGMGTLGLTIVAFLVAFLLWPYLYVIL